MPGRITIERAESHRDLVPGWTVQLDAMPHSPLASNGSTGEVSFSAPTTPQTIRTMYNAAVFEYFYPQFLDEVPIPATIPLPPPVVHPPGGNGWGEGTWGGGLWGGTQGSGSNQPPIASFTVTPNGLTVTLDASGSTDADGRIVSYAWTFGDGTTGSGVQTQHTYSADGTYPIQLTVLDDGNASGRATTSVSVAATPTGNQPPIPSFTVAPDGLSVTVDATNSTDPDGVIIAYAWDFGDGSTGTGVIATHTYAADGTYTIALSVTDAQGAVGQSTTTFTPGSGTNQSPIASFTTTRSGLTVGVDGTGSTDPDGVITSYAWNFGDGGTATGPVANHTYAAAGVYTITLTVTDDAGTPAQSNTQVSVTPTGTNQSPIPSFTVTPNALAVTVNGSASHDPDGTIVSWAWNFGDGALGTGVTATHTYAAAGTYTISLRVTDNGGLQGQTSTSVTLSTTGTGGWGTEAWGTDPWGA